MSEGAEHSSNAAESSDASALPEADADDSAEVYEDGDTDDGGAASRPGQAPLLPAAAEIANDDDDDKTPGEPKTPGDERPGSPVSAPTGTTSGGSGGSGGGGSKRKAAISVGMLDFVRLVLRTAVDSTVRQRAVDDRIIAPYIEELVTGGGGGAAASTTSGAVKRKLDAARPPSKRMRPLEPSAAVESDAGAAATTVGLAEARANEEFRLLTAKSKRSVYYGAVNALFVALERVNANLHFSREHLKYFLATHQRTVTVSDFADTGRLTTGSGGGGGGGGGGSKKQKSPSRLTNGAILVEYAKAPSAFAMNLSRCEPADVEAVRFVVETGMSLSQAVYRYLGWRLDDAQYTVDKVDQQRADHVRIPISNCKRAAVLIGESVLLLHDGVQFTLPPSNVERDITATMIAAARLKRKEHMVLDVLLGGARLRVIDIVHTDKFAAVPVDYAERLRLIAATLDGVKTVTWDESQQQVDGSYIEKSRFAHTEPGYIYYKPNTTLAAVGLQQNSVLLAYRDDAGDLVYRLNSPNAGPASLALSVAPLQPLGAVTTNSGPPPTIMLNDDHEVIGGGGGGCGDGGGGGGGRRVRIRGLEHETDLPTRLFTRAVPVEMRDGNRLGGLSWGNAVTHVREYKPPAAPRDAASNGSVSVVNLVNIFDDFKNFDTIMKALSKSTQYDRFVRTLKTENTNLTAFDLGY